MVHEHHGKAPAASRAADFEHALSRAEDWLRERFSEDVDQTWRKLLDEDAKWLKSDRKGVALRKVAQQKAESVAKNTSSLADAVRTALHNGLDTSFFLDEASVSKPGPNFGRGPNLGPPAETPTMEA